MSSNMQEIGGRFDHKMDSKYRVSIPVEWRPATGEKMSLLATERLGLPLVAVITKEDFAARLSIIEEAEHLTPRRKRQLKGMLHSRRRPATINDQGKLLVPKDWSQEAELESSSPVVLVGLGEYFEIWNPENYTQVKTREMEDAKEELEELGVL